MPLALSSRVQALWRTFKDTLWPPLCLKCRCIIKDAEGLCAPCWSQITWISKSQCTRCGYPLSIHDPDGLWLCGPCLQNPPIFDQGRSVLIYNEASQALVLGLKYGDRTHMAPVFGAWMARAASGLYNEDTWIVPVPLHWTRLWTRSYNQAALLGVFLSKHLQCPQYPVLKRARQTPSQGHKTRRQRHMNVRGAFTVNPSYHKNLQGRTVLLIDDVWTTGATLQACARTLKAAGASKVHVLTLARVALES